MKYSTTFAAVVGSASALAQGGYNAPSAYASSSSVATPSATYACNPAHEYPEGVKCVSTAGSLTLVSPSATASATYACNPAHEYPEGVRCVSTAGSLTLVSPSATSSKTPSTTGSASDCDTKYNTCRTKPDANFSYCASQYAECLGYNPFANNGTNTVTPAASGSDVYVTAIVTDYTTYCPSPTTFTHKQQTYTVTKATTLTLPCPGGCTVTKPVQSFPPATTVTAIVSSFTTYCPSPTTFTHQQTTYTVTKATTITVPCKGGCTITTPVSAIPPKSKKPRPSKPIVTGTGTGYPSKPTVVTAITTVCPTPTTVVHESSTYTVTKPTTLTLPCSTGCTVKPTASAPASSRAVPGAPAPSAPAPGAPGAPGSPSSVAAVPSRPAVTADASSSRVAYTGAAAPTAIPMAGAAVFAVGALFL